jgi:hypothetical protein
MRVKANHNDGKKPILEIPLEELGIDDPDPRTFERWFGPGERLDEILKAAKWHLKSALGSVTLPEHEESGRKLLVGENHFARYSLMNYSTTKQSLVVYAPEAKPPPPTFPQRAGDGIKSLLFLLFITCFLLGPLLLLVCDMLSFINLDPHADWREPVALHYVEDTEWWIDDNGTLVEQFGNNTSDLVPGDELQLGEVPSSHLLQRHYWSCYTYCSNDYYRGDYDPGSDCYTDCDRIAWHVFSVSVGGMEFILDGGDDFLARCFNAVCQINATVVGDSWEVSKVGDRVVLKPTSYEWVRWCQGEEVCE